MKTRVLVIGMGNANCGDDALGAAVAAGLTNRCGPAIRVAVSDALLWQVLDGGESAELLIIIDAAEESAQMPAGQWCRIRFPDQADVIESSRLRDTHRLNFDLILRMGQVLNTLPRDVWIYAMSGRNFRAGQPLSAPVSAAIPAMEQAIEKAIQLWLELNPGSKSQPEQVQHA